MKYHLYLLILIVSLFACGKESIPIIEEPVVSQKTFTLTFQNVMEDYAYFQSSATDLILPDASKSFTFIAGQGMQLSLATMLVESNDLFIAFEESGFSLYHEDGTAKTGDITYAFRLWDAGTEVNEMIGSGAYQAPRQTARNMGVQEEGVVALVDSLKDDIIYPEITSMLRASLVHNGDNQFTLTLENISHNESITSAFAPGVLAVHKTESSLFKANDAASPALETLAEDGDNSLFIGQLDKETGFTSIIGTGVYMVHPKANPMFTAGEPDRGEGLEILAEYGNPSELYERLKGDTLFSSIEIYNVSENNRLGFGGKLVPGDKYIFSFSASPGEYLSLGNMLVESNDLFFAFDDSGLELFPSGVPISRDVTDQIKLWDAGTEVNEYPGAGAFQPVRNGAKEATPEGGVVREVADEFAYPTIRDLVRVTIEVAD